MPWEVIIPMVGAFCAGWIAREALDFKIRADRFCRDLEAEVMKRKRDWAGLPSEERS